MAGNEQSAVNRRILWSTQGTVALEFVEGWRLARELPSYTFAEGNFENHLLDDSLSASAVIGHRIQAMDALFQSGQRVALAYLDCPRLSHYKPANERRRISTCLKEMARSSITRIKN